MNSAHCEKPGIESLVLCSVSMDATIPSSHNHAYEYSLIQMHEQIFVNASDLAGESILLP